jgi:branched-chain amino acid transport system ATP-binding protein
MDSAVETDTAGATGGEAALHVRQLSKRFGGVTAVDDVTFSLGQGEALAVIGPNGAGKSTLLRLLSGAAKPDSGTISYAGRDLVKLPGHAVAKLGIGLAHQVPRPFHGLTVRDNVAIGVMSRTERYRARARKEAVDEVLATCGLAAQAGLQASSLRLLDLKRLELARALSLNPSLILLDEVAAGLNGRELAELIELIRAIGAQGRGIIVVEHVEGVVASLVDRVIVIDWGKIIAEGTPAEVAADETVRQVYLGAGNSAVRPHAGAAASAPAGRDASLLEVRGLGVAYGDVTAVRDANLAAGRGEIVAVLGANGAGKSSLAGAIGGLLRPRSGEIRFDGRDVTRQAAYLRNRGGIALCPEGRRVFADLTVRENLLLPVGLRLHKRELARRLESVHEIFPTLASRRDQRAGTMSGGQQGMLAIGRSLMSEPALLVCDEISLGLAPVAIDALYEALEKIRARGVAIVLIEQNVHRSLNVADRVYVLDRGQITYDGPPGPLRDPAVLDRFYFGKGSALADPELTTS